MADQLIFAEPEVTFLQALVRHKVDFMIVGLAAAALQGAPVVTQDVDLWFRSLPDPGLEAALRECRGIYVPPTASTPPMLAGRGIELFDIVVRMDGLGDFETERAETIKLALGRSKVLVLKLERIIASKRAAGRGKDQLVLKVLEDALKTIQERGS